MEHSDRPQDPTVLSGQLSDIREALSYTKRSFWMLALFFITLLVFVLGQVFLLNSRVAGFAGEASAIRAEHAALLSRTANLESALQHVQLQTTASVRELLDLLEQLHPAERAKIRQQAHRLEQLMIERLRIQP